MFLGNEDISAFVRVSIRIKVIKICWNVLFVDKDSCNKNYCKMISQMNSRAFQQYITL